MAGAFTAVIMAGAFTAVMMWPNGTWRLGSVQRGAAGQAASTAAFLITASRSLASRIR
jgi:hypothetical protein